MWGTSPLIHTKSASLFPLLFTLLFSPRQWLVLFFAAFSSAGSCFGLTQAVCFAEQGLLSLSLPLLVSVFLSGSLPKKIPSVRTPAFSAFTGWAEGPSSGNSPENP